MSEKAKQGVWGDRGEFQPEGEVTRELGFEGWLNFTSQLEAGQGPRK